MISLLPESLDALFLSNSINIRYLCGFSGLSPLEREAYLLITKKNWHLFTFKLYQEEAEIAAATYAHIKVHYITPEYRIPDLLSSVYKEEMFTTMGFEQYSLNVKEYTEIKTALPNVILSPDHGTIELRRQKKSEAEIEKLKQAIELTDDCFVFIQSVIKKDITEAELAWRIERYFREHNAQLSFPPIVAYNQHSSIPHHVSDSHTKLEPSSLILIDFGAKVNGYHADMTRVVFFGGPKDEWLQGYETVKKAQEDVIDYLSNNKIKEIASPDMNRDRNDVLNSGAKADEIARSVITHAGYPVYPHSLGHGVGLEIHENPRLSVHRDQSLEEGMVFSIEPGLYLAGKFGIRIEDLALKTEDGIEILSKASKELIVL